MTLKNYHNLVSRATSSLPANGESKLAVTVVVMTLSIMTIWLLSSVALNGIVYAQAGTADQNGAVGSTNQTITLLRYLNPTFGIEMDYPSSWQAYELWRSDSPLVANTIVAMVPAGDNASGFRDSLLVGMQGSEGKTLNEYTVDSLNAYRDAASNVTITQSSPTTLDGIPAHEIEYLENFQGNELQKKQVWTIIDNRAYIVTYGADVSQYENYLEDVDAMIDSLQISRTPPELTTNTSSPHPTEPTLIGT